MYRYLMLTATSCSASGLRAVFLGLALHIYIYIYIYVARTERKGAYGHICVFVEHICILQALQTYIYGLYICLPCLFVCIYAFCLLHVCKWVQISANVCSVARLFGL